MKMFFSFILIFYINCAYAQKPDWQKATNWKLYELHGHGLFNYSLDTLKNFKYYSLNDDSMQYFLKSTISISQENSPVWMGAYVASCKLNGSAIKIDISQYGGFFYYEKKHAYYEIPEIIRKEWLNYFSDCFKTLHYERN